MSCLDPMGLRVAHEQAGFQSPWLNSRFNMEILHQQEKALFQSCQYTDKNVLYKSTVFFLYGKKLLSLPTNITAKIISLPTLNSSGFQ